MRASGFVFFSCDPSVCVSVSPVHPEGRQGLAGCTLVSYPNLLPNTSFLLLTVPQAAEASQGRVLRFLANVDPVDVARATQGLDPEETLVISLLRKNACGWTWCMCIHTDHMPLTLLTCLLLC